jgi:hypothetical protein
MYPERTFSIHEYLHIEDLETRQDIGALGVETGTMTSGGELQAKRNIYESYIYGCDLQ